MQVGIGIPVVGMVGGAITGCGGEPVPVCANPDDWSVSEAGLRKVNNYTESSPHSDKNCLNCAFFKPDPSLGNASCGHCDIFTGPAHQDAYCDSWSEIA